jgi:hypothetical protein
MRSLGYDLSQRVRVILTGPASPVAGGARRGRGAGAPAIVLSMNDRRPLALVHELAHAFTGEIAPNLQRTAPWLAEGFAEHARGVWDPADLGSVRRAVQAGGIPAVTAMPDSHWGQALFDYIVVRTGEEGVRRFFFALRARAEVGAAIQMAFGVPPAEFGQTFAGYLRDRFGVP